MKRCSTPKALTETTPSRSSANPELMREQCPTVGVRVHQLTRLVTAMSLRAFGHYDQREAILSAAGIPIGGVS